MTIKNNIDKRSDIIDSFIGTRNVYRMKMAIGRGDKFMIKKLFEWGFPNDYIDDNGDTLILNAINSYKVSSLEELIDNGCDINQPNIYTNDTPLLAACRKSNAVIFSILMDNGVDFKKRNNRNFNPCHYCAINNNVFALESLMFMGIEYDTPCVDGFTPVMYAGYFGNPMIIEKLIERNVNLNVINSKNNYSLAMQSALGGRPDGLLKLLEHDIDVHSIGDDGHNVLSLCIENLNYDDWEACDLLIGNLLKRKVDVNIKYNIFIKNDKYEEKLILTPLIKSILMLDEQLCKSLLENGADPNLSVFDDKTAIDFLFEKIDEYELQFKDKILSLYSLLKKNGAVVKKEYVDRINKMKEKK